jgi:integrase/recombinase XerD
MDLQHYLAERYMKRSAHCYTLMIDHYRKHVQDPEQAKYKDVLGYLEKRRSEGRHARTIMSYLSAVKAYYDWMKKTGRRKDHPCKHLRLKDRIDPRVNVHDLFSSIELDLLLEQEQEKNWHTENLLIRDKVILTLLIYQGLTTRDIVNLETKEVNLEQATIYIKKGSTLNARTLELHPKQIMMISRYLTEERPALNKKNSSKLIVTKRGNPESGCAVRKIIGQLKHLFPNKNLTALTVRQSVITNLLKAGKDIRAVQVFAGHKSPMTTERYQQTGIEELTTAVMKFHPLK